MNKDFSELVEYLDGKFVKIDEKFDKIDEKFVRIDNKFDVIDARLNKIDAKLDEKADKKDVQGLINSIDKLTKSIMDYHEEYVALTAKVDRHEKWFLQIAEKLGLKLEY